jgi:hypothetical protein
VFLVEFAMFVLTSGFHFVSCLVALMVSISLQFYVVHMHEVV